MAAIARMAALQALKACKSQSAELFQLQARKMSGGAGAPFHVSYNGKPPPEALRGPGYITYAGLTLPKRAHDYDYWFSKVMGGAFWFTMFYHGYLNWDEHWYGDIWVFERDVQLNGWGDEEHEAGDADAHGHAAHGHA